MDKNIERDFMNEEFRKLDLTVQNAYERAEKRAVASLEEYTGQYSGIEKALQRRVISGEISEKEKEAYMYDLLYGEDEDDWMEEAGELAGFYTDADEDCLNYANDRVEDIYVSGRNFSNYESDMYYHRDLGVDLLKTAGVSKLLKVLDRDKAQDWNTRRVKLTFTRYKETAKTVFAAGKKALKGVTKKSKKGTGNSLQRYLWGVDDQAKWEHMMKLAEKGLHIQKKWSATLDAHTRDTHRTLDGEIAEIDEEFEVGPYSIMFPREPYAAPAMTINCRCQLVYLFPKYQDLRDEDSHTRIENIRDPERRVIPDMTYREWEKWKEGKENGGDKR